ncbi:hypothetical protein LXA43DRAFT_1066176 [Ganoderma leucocontextum]|nr:hypothetical protein LXA43DRAFT_1066176 [Ganoderma leucocontextum]
MSRKTRQNRKPGTTHTPRSVLRDRNLRSETVSNDDLPPLSSPQPSDLPERWTPPVPVAMLIVGEEVESDPSVAMIIVGEYDDDDPPPTSSTYQSGTESHNSGDSGEGPHSAASSQRPGVAQLSQRALDSTAVPSAAMIIVGEAEDDDLPLSFSMAGTGAESNAPSRADGEEAVGMTSGGANGAMEVVREGGIVVPRIIMRIVGEAEDNHLAPTSSTSKSGTSNNDQLSPLSTPTADNEKWADSFTSK